MATITKEKKQDGSVRWWVRGYVGGKAVSERFPKQSSAKAFLRQVEHEAAEAKKATKLRRVSGRAVDMGFPDAIAQYIAKSREGRAGKPALEPSTLAQYTYYLEAFLEDAFDGMTVVDMTRQDGNDARDYLVETCTSRGLAIRVLNFARAVMNYAIDELELRDDNPLNRVKIVEDVRVSKKKRKVHTRAQMLKVMETAKGFYEHPNGATRKAWVSYYPLLLFLVYSGTRISEALGAQWGDFDQGLSVFSVQRKINRYVPGVTSEDRVGRVKSKHAFRDIPLPSTVSQALSELRSAHDSEWVFPNRRGEPKDYTAIYRNMWTPLLKAAGVPHMGLHATRHYYASMILRDGFIHELQELLGHHSASFTLDTYGDLIDDPDARRKRIADRLEIDISEVREIEEDSESSAEEGESSDAADSVHVQTMSKQS